MKMTDELKQLLEDIREYMDSKADADHNGENYQPNKEMKFKERIEKVKADAAPENTAMPDVEKLCEEYLPNQFELKSFKKKEILFLKTAFEQGARVMFNTLKNNKPLYERLKVEADAAPDQNKTDDGWTYDYGFLYNLTIKIRDTFDISMEQVEAVLLAIDFKGKADAAPAMSVEKKAIELLQSVATNDVPHNLADIEKFLSGLQADAAPDDVTILKRSDKALTELRKNTASITHLLNKDENTSYNTGFHKGFELGYKAAVQSDAAPDGWIRVEDKPKKGVPILLYNGYWTGVGFYKKNYKLKIDGEPIWSDETGEYITPEPTHWQPLPPPPKKQ